MSHGSHDRAAATSAVTSRGPVARSRRTLIDHDVLIPARDGTLLATDIYRPDDDAPHPCLLQRVPYSKDSPGIVNGALDVNRAIARGYAVAVQDCRGRYRSEGRFTPFRDDAADGEATIRWLTDQGWCNGSVALFGRSYAGMNQWHTAASEIAGLRAIAPIFSGLDVADEWISPQGVTEWGFGRLWCIRYLAPDARLRAEGDRTHGFTRDELLEIAGDPDAFYAGLDPSTEQRLEALVPFLRAFSDDPPNEVVLPAGVPTVPAFLIGGWFDLFLRGTMHAHRLLDGSGGIPEHALLVGPWAHGGSNGGVFPERDFGVRASSDAVGLTDLQLDWFDRWCQPRPEPSKPDFSPRVRIFVTGIDEWRVGESWPPEGVASVPLYVTPAGLESAPSHHPETLDIRFDETDPVPTIGGGTFLPGLEIAANAGPRDQRPIVHRADVLVLRALEPRPMEVLGEVTLELHLEHAAVGTRVVARLVDVEPDGRLLVLCEAAGRTSSATTPMQLSVGWVAHSFRPGHSVALILCCTSVPRYGGPVVPGTDSTSGTVRVRCGPSAASSLRLPAHAPGEEVT